MMEFLASSIERFGDRHVLAIGGLVIGLLFGLLAQRSRYCARAAVLECCERQPALRTSVWWLGFAVAVLAVQLLVLMGGLQPEVSRFIAQPGSYSGAVLGGLLFGMGMVLAKACAGRMIVLSGQGNLRALLAGLVFAVAVQASIGGWLAPLRRSLAGLWQVDPGPDRNVLHLLGVAPWMGSVVGLLMLVSALVLFSRHHRGRWGLGLMASGAGLCVALAWGFTQAVASQSFEAIAVQSLTYSSPSAEWLMRVLSSDSAASFGFESGLLPATFAGAFLGALLGRDFKFEGFKTENRLGHYMIGAVFMGFGAVLAGGCTIGAGMSGGSIFAVSAWLTLLSIWLGAALTWRAHKALGWSV